MSFTPRPSERAPRYTDARTRAADADRDAGFQRFHDALAEYVGREEMFEIIGIVVNENGWTRVKLGRQGSRVRAARGGGALGGYRGASASYVVHEAGGLVTGPREDGFASEQRHGWET